MADADLEQFLEKIRQLNAFVALSENNAELREALRSCSHHNEVVALARSHGFEIGRRWGERHGLVTSSNVSHHLSSLLGGTTPPPGQESVQVVLACEGMRLERIHSCGASSAPDFWYEQQEHEWVCLLQGTARVQFADEAKPRLLQTGDSLLIRARHRHRVVSTDPDPGTIWLALFWQGDPAG